MNIHFGSKYYTYKKEERYAFRPIEVNDDKVLVRNVNQDKVTTTFIPKTFLEQLTVEVLPDALLDIMITEYEDGRKDIYAWVFRIDAIAANKLEAALMLRQDVISHLKNEYMLNNNSQIMVGECLTELNNPTDDKLMDFAEYHKIVKDHSVSVYLSDTTEDILGCFPQSFLEDVNDVLADLAKLNSDQIHGYCENIEQLFKENDFIANYRSLFNIQQIDYPIILGPESYNQDGDIELNSKQHEMLENMLRKKVTNVKVLEYDHDIDIKNIVSQNHILVSDKTEKIFLITFDTIGLYPMPDDVVEAMYNNS